ncbi:TonB-dependent receptor [Gammaproteobacteria bacterium]|nr:TonB-dependent receptor [Gammaproteobacteria bacterium]
MSKISVLLKNTILSSIVIISFAVTAQEIEEVVVTATKKEESVQDLAISIEALTAESLADNQVYDVSDLAEITPGLETAKVIGSGSGWVVRGIGSGGIGAGVVASVVTAVNGHSVNDSVVADTGFMDLERVEVLKGPQGTLYGRNAANGVINLITARPTSDFEGSYDVEVGTYGKITTKAVVNMPFSDSIKTRLAVMSNKRDGMVTNLVTGNDFDDRNDEAFRLSVDWDISDNTDLEFTYGQQESDDTRFQEEISYCAQDQFYGCNPYVRGQANVAADSRGHIAGFFGFLAHLHPGSIMNVYSSNAVIYSSDDFSEIRLNREPTHEQKQSVANLQLNHNLSDDLLLTAKVSYETREFYQSGDNDQAYTDDPLFGSAASLGQPPITGYLCFGGERQFCETVDSDRTYDFSDVNMHGTQMEVNLVSSYDGAFNYTLGIYQNETRNDNVYLAQTTGSQFFRSFDLHPYSDVVLALTGNDWSSKGGVGFYQDMLTWLSLAGNALGCGGALGPAAQAACNPALLEPYATQTAKQANSLDVVIPWDLTGVINDQNVDDISRAIYGEMYFDLSDDTKLTVGARYQDDEVVSTVYNDTAGGSYLASGCFMAANKDTCSFVDVTPVEDDAFTYKLALQHNLSDDVMVYGSYTTAIRAAGVNAGDNPTTYDQEKNSTIDFGLKSILMDGAMLLNMNVFNTVSDGFLVAAVQNTGTKNTNIDADVKGFEGNMMVFLSETTKLEANWLFLDHEVTSDTMMINYLNPAGAPVAQYLGAVDPNGTGLITGAVHTNGRVLFKSAGFNCTVAGLYTDGCATGEPGWAESIKGNALPGSSDKSYGLSLTQDFNSSNGVTSARLSYRYRGSFDSDIFNMDRMKIDAQDTMDLLISYEPNEGDWYAGIFVKNIRDQQHLQILRPASNVQGGQLFGSFSDPRIWGVQFGSKF